jgi:pyrimidine deaminase RibD-like protein
MTELEETLVYDALAAITKHSVVLCELVKRAGDEEQQEAYKAGVYAPAIKLQVILGQDALERGRKRHEKIAADCAKFFENVTDQARHQSAPEVGCLALCHQCAVERFKKNEFDQFHYGTLQPCDGCGNSGPCVMMPNKGNISNNAAAR